MSKKKLPISSFKYAISGLLFAFKTQKNIRFHTLIAFLVIISSILLKCSYLEITILLAMIALVISMELGNTSIEATIDLISLQSQPMAKIAKDVGAAAVLISALFSLIVGLLIFLPKLLAYLKG